MNFVLIGLFPLSTNRSQSSMPAILNHFDSILRSTSAGSASKNMSTLPRA